jgi:MerR family transcriptional regulator, heat shock protein HspR
MGLPLSGTRSETGPDTRPGTGRGVYGISVAAELTGIGTQNLRLYESRGLLQPERTAGGTRRYSDQDLTRLRRIAALLENGLNLAGIAMVLDLENSNQDLRTANTGLRTRNTVLRAANAQHERAQHLDTSRRQAQSARPTRRKSDSEPDSGV